MTGDRVDDGVMKLAVWSWWLRCPRGRLDGVYVGDACVRTAARRAPPRSTGQGGGPVRRARAGDHNPRWPPRRGV